MNIINVPNYDGAGIYLISGVNNNFKYVGSSNNVQRRIQQHNAAMKNGKFQSKRLEEICDADFEFTATVLEKIDGKRSKYYLRDREHYYISKYNTYGEFGLNTAPIAGYSKQHRSSLIHEVQYLAKLANEYLEREKRDDISLSYKDKLLTATEKDIRNLLHCILATMEPVSGQ